MWHREDYITLIWGWTIVICGYIVFPLLGLYGLYTIWEFLRGILWQ